MDELIDHVRAMLKGKEVVVPALAATPAVGDLVFSALMEPRTLAMPCIRIRSSTSLLAIPGGTPTRFASGYGARRDEDKLIVGQGSGRAVDVARLSLGLGHAQATMRRRSADQLGLIGPEARDASAALGRLLHDKDLQVRLAAAVALARIEPGHRAAVALLLDGLKAKEAADRLHAVDALWVLDRVAPGTIPALVAVEIDPEPRVRDRAAFALHSLLRSVTGDDAATVADLLVALRAQNDACRLAAVVAFRHKAPADVKPVVPQIARALKDADSFVRAEAAGTLARLDPAHPDVPAVLAEILLDIKHKQVYPGGMIRTAALDALSRIGPAGRVAVPAMIASLEDKHNYLEALKILQQLGPEGRAAAPALRQAVALEPMPGYPELPLLAAVALAHVAPRDAGNEQAVARLIAAVKDRRLYLAYRVAAVEGLGRFGATAAPAMPALEEALKDGFEEVRDAARTALKAIRAS